MAIRIVDGIPRSGKTFYGVRHFAKNFCDFIEEDYYIKDGITVISNIDGLTLPHIKLSDLVYIPNKLNKFVAKIMPWLVQPPPADVPSMMDFFSYSYQENVIFPKYGAVVYIIDEAQVFWRKNDRSEDIKEVFHWMELHGHFGQDIYLITQSYKKLPSDISIMPEYIIHSVPRSRSMTGEFRYKQIAEGGEVQRKFGIYPDQKIFDLYKSSSAKETEKVTNPMMRQTLVIFALVLCLLGGFGWFLYHRLHPEQSSPIQEQVSQNEISKQIKITSPQDLGKQDLKKQDLEKVDTKPILVSVPVNHILTTKGKKTVLSIFFQGQIMDISDFPFPVEFKGKTLFAKIDSRLLHLFKPDKEKKSSYEGDESSPAERLERSGADEAPEQLAFH